MPIEARKTIQLDGFKNTRKLEVGIMISCPQWWFQGLQVMRWAITHRPQDLPRSKHTLAEGKPWKELRFIDKRSYRNFSKPEGCEGTIVVCLACTINGLFRTQFMDKRNSAMLWGWPSVRIRDSLNHIQGNDLGAGWIDHHADLLLLFASAIWDGKSEWLTYSRETMIKTLFEP